MKTDLLPFSHTETWLVLYATFLLWISVMFKRFYLSLCMSQDFFPRYFILFCSLLLCNLYILESRKTIVFYILILWQIPHWRLLLVLIFLLIFPGFAKKAIILNASNDHFASTFPIAMPIISVICFSEFINTTKAELSHSGDSSCCNIQLSLLWSYLHCIYVVLLHVISEIILFYFCIFCRC